MAVRRGGSQDYILGGSAENSRALLRARSRAGPAAVSTDLTGSQHAFPGWNTVGKRGLEPRRGRDGSSAQQWKPEIPLGRRGRVARSEWPGSSWCSRTHIPDAWHRQSRPLAQTRPFPASPSCFPGL